MPIQVTGNIIVKGELVKINFTIPNNDSAKISLQPDVELDFRDSHRKEEAYIKIQAPDVIRQQMIIQSILGECFLNPQIPVEGQVYGVSHITSTRIIGSRSAEGIMPSVNVSYEHSSTKNPARR